jgi:hypothetical protein
VAKCRREAAAIENGFDESIAKIRSMSLEELRARSQFCIEQARLIEKGLYEIQE